MTERKPSATVHVGPGRSRCIDPPGGDAAPTSCWTSARCHTTPEAVARAVSRWPRVRCCYEAGPTGYGLARQLRARGIACDVVAPGLVPVRPGDRIKTDPRDARKLARLHAGGLLEAITVPSEQVEALRDLVRAREDARIDRMRDRHRMSKFLLRHDLRMPNKSWGVTRRKWLGSLTFELRPSTAGLSDLPARAGPRRPSHRSARARPRRGGQGRPVGAARRTVALLARHRHADRAGAGRRDRHRLVALSDRRAVHELRRPGPVGVLVGPVASPGLDHEGRQRSRPPTARRGRVASAPAPPRRRGARCPPARPGPARSSSAPGAPSSACTAAGRGWPRAASRTRRSSSRPPASSPGSSGRSRPTNHSGAPKHQPPARVG